MAVFPRETQDTIDEAEDSVLTRWKFVAAALLIALVGLVFGTVRDSQSLRIVHSAEKNTGTPQVSKRDPARLPAMVERRDGGTAHIGDLDGALPAPRIASLTGQDYRSSALVPAAAPVLDGFWPTSLPRAPPFLT